jgi:molecular chaperone HtpG
MIKIPQLFAEKLNLNLSLAADVRKTFDRFEPWLEGSGMPFFPGFTDHSPRHINEVLITAASMISDESHALLSAEDVAVLCMAVLLHDCGMHLTQDSFRNLVSDFGPPLINGFGDLPWGVIWKEFLSEANRFGQEKLVAVFGDSQPISLKDIDLTDLSERDCLLIGEFVRRHHTRIAHEIAIKGVSWSGGIPLALSFEDLEICDLAGLVARSHGMSIRATFEYIESRYTTISTYRNIKSPYLMAVLRIADYVQVQSERAIRTLLSVKELRSPLSRQEWLNHFAVKDITNEHADPQAFFVNAAPKDVRTYLRLVALFKDIQRELDESWATIGEVYGRSPSLGSLGLTMRRIRSNLDVTERFARTVQYIPVQANFDSSGPDLLKLLVGPLYDYKYEVGIRELIQNAVDASRERLNFAGQDPSFDRTSLTVRLEIHEANDGTGWVTITDNGVGMTLDTVTRYFLIAGASFRNSDAWKRQHVDDSGKAKVLRGGRFGVGALAAFLLGSEIQVTTRHVDRSELEGITFSARIDDPVVELKRCVAPVGTQIRIFVSDSTVFDELRPAFITNEQRIETTVELSNWQEVDWYVHLFPEVVCLWTGFDQPVSRTQQRTMYSGKFKLRDAFTVPDMLEEINGWHALPDPTPYQRIIWRYSSEVFAKSEYGYVADEISVNGIRVEGLNDFGPVDTYVNLREPSLGFSPRIRILRPSMAISDPAGICPINLQRSAISFERMGTEERLAEAVLEFHFERIRDAATQVLTLADLYLFCARFKFAEGIQYPDQIGPLCSTHKGIMILSVENMRRSGIKKLVFIDCDLSNVKIDIIQLLRKDEAFVLREQGEGAQAYTSWFRAFFAAESRSSHSYYNREVGIPYVRSEARVIFLLGESWGYINSKKRVSRYILDQVENRLVEERVLAYSGPAGIIDQLQLRCTALIQVLPESAEVGVWLIDSYDKVDIEESVMEKVWRNTFGGQYFK